MVCLQDSYLLAFVEVLLEGPLFGHRFVELQVIWGFVLASLEGVGDWRGTLVAGEQEFRWLLVARGLLLVAEESLVFLWLVDAVFMSLPFEGPAVVQFVLIAEMGNWSSVCFGQLTFPDSLLPLLSLSLFAP